jgi:hypothetical protein
MECRPRSHVDRARGRCAPAAPVNHRAHLTRLLDQRRSLQGSICSIRMARVPVACRLSANGATVGLANGDKFLSDHVVETVRTGHAIRLRLQRALPLAELALGRLALADSRRHTRGCERAIRRRAPARITVLRSLQPGRSTCAKARSSASRCSELEVISCPPFHEREAQRRGLGSWSRTRWRVLTIVLVAIVAAVVLLVLYTGGGGGNGGGY